MSKQQRGWRGCQDSSAYLEALERDMSFLAQVVQILNPVHLSERQHALLALIAERYPQGGTHGTVRSGDGVGGPDS